MGFPGGSDGKECACSVEYLGSIPGLGRSPGGGDGNSLHILAWRIPWTEVPGRLQSMGSQRVRHNWANEHNTMPLKAEDSHSTASGTVEPGTQVMASGMSFLPQALGCHASPSSSARLGRDVTQLLQTHILLGQFHPGPSTCLRNGCLGDARHCAKSLLASFH